MANDFLLSLFLFDLLLLCFLFLGGLLEDAIGATGLEPGMLKLEVGAAMVMGAAAAAAAPGGLERRSGQRTG